MSEYTQRANKFLDDTDTHIYFRMSGIVDGFPFSDDTMKHNKYTVTLKREGKKYSFPFYDSYHNYLNHKKPTPYDVLACLQSYPVDDNMWNFANEFGYEINSEETYNKVKEIWKNCREQYESLLDLFGPELMEKLGEIQ